jgi:hypothetical protein
MVVALPFPDERLTSGVGTQKREGIMVRKLLGNRPLLGGLSCLFMGILPFLSSPETARASTYYVSKSTANGWSTGSDSSACTATNTPCLSIAGGLAKMSSGDTLIINDGTYVESLDDLVPSGGGTEGSRTVVKCFKPRACTLDASFWAWNFVNSDTNWITVQDMVICCGDSVLVRLGTSSSVPTTNYPHHMRFQNNEIHTSKIYPIYTGHGYGNEWLSNTIHDCGEQCVYLLEMDSLWRGNEFYRVLNGAQFITMHTSGGMSSSNVLIENNYLHDCIGGHWMTMVGIEIGNTSGHTIRRNVITNCAVAGIRATTGVVTDTEIDHNVLYGNGTGIAITSAASTGNKIRNNIALGNAGAQISICSGCGVEVTNLTVGVPTDIWTSPANRVFTLKAGSAAIDRGSPIGLPFNGYAPDCGAYETGIVMDTTAPRPPVILSLE